MKIKDVLNNSNFNLINNGDTLREINKTFASDLLSHVMGFAEEDDILITVLNNINVLGVASLLDFSGVIFSHNINVNDAIIAKANELNIPLLRTKLSTAEAVVILDKLGV
jgi:serine kinase of HPr protein (carbohydrate metabolism regulator)